MGTLSKTMGPGMRLGWLVGPSDLISRLAALKVDGGTNVFGAHVAADWLPEHLLPHVSRLRAVYRRRRDLMLAALERHMPPGTSWTVPEGGFFIWVTLPEPIDTTRSRSSASSTCRARQAFPMVPVPISSASRSRSSTTTRSSEGSRSSATSRRASSARPGSRPVTARGRRWSRVCTVQPATYGGKRGRVRAPH